jgi:hypothetical protein
MPKLHAYPVYPYAFKIDFLKISQIKIVDKNKKHNEVAQINKHKLLCSKVIEIHLFLIIGVHATRCNQAGHSQRCV